MSRVLRQINKTVMNIILTILMIPAIVVGWLAFGFWAHDYLTNKNKKK
jgi:uncharacterized membrane protein YqaE (UPF0057 family)